MSSAAAKKHPHHNVPKAKHRPPSQQYSLKYRANMAQKTSLRQRPPAVITLPRAPWMEKDQ